MGVINCCRGCVAPKRHRACWDSCPEYLAEKAEYERKKAELAKEYEISGALYDERRRKIERAIRSHRRI